jgi:hypothetical protein
LAGVNVCPFADVAGCWQTCLNTAGRGGMAKRWHSPHGVEIPDNQVQAARIARTRLFAENLAEFTGLLHDEIEKFLKRAKRLGLTPAIRLNGTSDIVWEQGGLIAQFPDVQFYDYTKISTRTELPSNYHLTLSYSEANEKFAKRCVKAHVESGINLAVVVRDENLKQHWLEHFPPALAGVVDGDADDLRFNDEPKSIVLLKAKGKARKEMNGFVLDDFDRLAQYIREEKQSAHDRPEHRRGRDRVRRGDTVARAGV